MDIQSIIASFQNAGGAQQAAANAGVSTEDASNVTQAALEHADAGGGMEGMVEAVAQRAGIDPSLVQQILPHVMPMLQSHLAGVEGTEGSAGVLGNLGGASGIMGMIGGMFGGRKT